MVDIFANFVVWFPTYWNYLMTFTNRKLIIEAEVCDSILDYISLGNIILYKLV